MNRKIYILILLTFALLTTGCNKVEQIVIENEKLVQVEEVTQSSKKETINYFGFIEPSEIKSFSLKNSGKINNINIAIGDTIAINNLLLTLDTYEYNLFVKASNEQINLAILELSKAKKSFDFYEKLYNDTLSLYKNNAVSKQKLDEIKLTYDINNDQYEQANKNYNQAKIDLDFKSNSVSDSSLISDMNGVVVDVLKKEGEIYAAGYPVILVRSNENIVKIGVSEKDIKRLQIGMDANIEIDDEFFKGTIKKISLMPDKFSRTYSVEISLENDNFIIGESCNIAIELNTITGIWIPIIDIKNDGEDYVCTVKDNRAVRTNIYLHEINGSYVRVTNLDIGDLIITTGTNSLSEGQKVKIVGDSNE